MVIILPPRPSVPSPLLPLNNIRCIFDDITTCYFIQSLILVLYLEKRLAVLDGELRHHRHRARPEHIAMHRDVVAEDLGEDPPVLQLPVQHLVTPPHPPLHSPIFCRTLDFVGVAAVPLISLDPLTRLEEIKQNLVENFNVGILTGRVWPLDPHQVPCEDVNAQHVAQGRLPRVLPFEGCGSRFHPLSLCSR